MKPTWTHLDLAKEWKRRGNQRMVLAIAKSCFRLMKKARAAGTANA